MVEHAVSMACMGATLNTVDATRKWLSLLLYATHQHKARDIFILHHELYHVTSHKQSLGPAVDTDGTHQMQRCICSALRGL